MSCAISFCSIHYLGLPAVTTPMKHIALTPLIVISFKQAASEKSKSLIGGVVVFLKVDSTNSFVHLTLILIGEATTQTPST
jgi:hypothetical protein